MKNLNLLAFTLLLTTLSVSAEQDRISATGIGLADTKVKACELALDYARKEAAQTAVTIVLSTFTTMETERGISSTNDVTATSKAFAKLIEKTEKTSFNEGTGQIQCNVTAQFFAGYISDDQANSLSQAPLNSQNKIEIGEFKAGEPFCSKIIRRCFREIYSKQLKEFGIQILPIKSELESTEMPMGSNPNILKALGILPKANKDSSSTIPSDSTKFNMFFNRIKRHENDKEYIKVESRENLIKFIKEFASRACDTCDIWMDINMRKWSSLNGFDNTNVGFQRYMNAHARYFTKTRNLAAPEPPIEYIKLLDIQMNKTQNALDNLF